MEMPVEVKYIMQRLIENGFECYLVGGAVRDSLLGLTPKDYDFCTNARPDDIERVFERTIPTGKEYGTIAVMVNEFIYEVTTYRLECDYDGRRPQVVKFGDSLKEDLSRRDFTINAMAMDIDGNIIDYFGGRKDLKYGEIVCVGDAVERFREDKLRILRAFRFASRYDFDIYRSILYAIQEDNDISMLSKERVREEFNKILLSEKPSRWIKTLSDFGLLHQIVPELSKCYMFQQHNPNHDKDVFEHIMSVLDNTKPKLELRLSALFHDIGKPNTFSMGEDGIGHFYGHHEESARICRKVMTELKYSNKEIEYVSSLVLHHMTRYDKLRPTSVKRFINKVGVDRLDDLFDLFVADRLGSKPPYDFESIYRLKFECERILVEKQPLSIKDLEINGYHLMSIGFSQGKELGDTLKHLLDVVLENPSLNQEDKLVEIAKKWVNR